MCAFFLCFLLFVILGLLIYLFWSGARAEAQCKL